MNLEVGQKLSYYPPQNDGDNIHWPRVVEAIKEGKRARIKVRVFAEGMPPEGKTRWVGKLRLLDQPDIFH